MRQPEIEAIFAEWFALLHGPFDERHDHRQKRDRLLDKVIADNPRLNLSRYELLETLFSRYEAYESGRFKIVPPSMPPRA